MGTEGYGGPGFGSCRRAVWVAAHNIIYLKERCWGGVSDAAYTPNGPGLGKSGIPTKGNAALYVRQERGWEYWYIPKSRVLFVVMVVVVRPSEMERGGYILPPPSPSDDEPSSLTDETWEPVRLSLWTHTKMTTTLLDRESPSFFLTGGPPQRETRGGGHGERRWWDSRMYRRRCAGQGGGWSVRSLYRSRLM